MPEGLSEHAQFYKDARTDGVGPLHGVHVLEVGTTWAGPRCCQVLADYGAEVIKVETRRAPDVTRRLPPMMSGTDPPDGYLNATVNRNKKSVTLDLAKPEGRDVFLRLCERADIVVQNLKKGTLSGWGCGYEDVRAVKPDIVYVAITAFGQYGPYSDRPGYDPLAQALSGFMHMNAPKEGDPPNKAPIFLADELGGLHAVMGALAALHHRDRTGEGQLVDISLVDAIVDSSTGLHTMAANGFPTPRLGNTFSFAAPSNAYECLDGWVYAGVLIDSHWRALAPILGRPELADDPGYNSVAGRMAHRDELETMFAAWCRERSRDEVIGTFAEHGLPAGPVMTPQEAVANEHIAAREDLQQTTTDDGATYTIPASSAKFSRTPIRIRTAARALGADTDQVLEALGYGSEERARLRESGAL